MLNYLFTCNNCHVTFSMTEKDLAHATSLTCPHCDAKLPANELRHLKSDMEYRKKHSGFQISVSDTPNIDLEDLSFYALSRSINSVLNLFEMESRSDEFDSFVADNKYLLTFCNIYSRNLLLAYHRKIADILQKYSISLGDIIVGSPPASASPEDLSKPC